MSDKSVLVTVRNITDYYNTIDLLVDASIPFNDLSSQGYYCLECSLDSEDFVLSILRGSGVQYSLRHAR